MVEQKMGRRNAKTQQKSQTLPSSPTHYSSSSSSDFEFAVSTSPRISSAVFCPADDLFYKGKLLPLYLSPRISMVQTIKLDDSAASRDSTASGSSNESSFSGDVNPLPSVDFHHSRTSSVAGDDEVNRLKKQEFSISRISPVLKKEPKKQDNKTGSYKEFIRGCVKKVKPLFEKLSIKQPEHGIREEEAPGKYSKQSGRKVSRRSLSNVFAGNLVYPRMPATCPSSPNHHHRLKSFSDVSSSMEELPNAIQGAITHCKDSMKLDG